jgi:hypothetical protein
MISAADRWSRIEGHTRGLIGGPALLGLDAPVQARSIIVPDGRDFAIAGLEAFPGWVPFRRTFKIEVRAREGGELLWCRPFATEDETVALWARIAGIDLERSPEAFWLPSRFTVGELDYYICTVATFNATTVNGAADWNANGTLVPTDVTSTDYLVIAGGGGGGSTQGGGGGAGGYRASTGFAVTPGASTTLTVGGGGAAATSGSDSVFATVTSTAGGRGANNGVGTAGGSGGGGANSGAGGAGTGGQGNNGGTAGSGGAFPGGGGGGASAVGADAPNNTTGGNGGAGTASSISGSSVTRGGGGGGGLFSAGTIGNGGAGGGGNGSAAGTGVAGTANTGGGGGGGATGGAGGSGVIILSFTAGTGHPVIKRFGGVPFASRNSGVW